MADGLRERNKTAFFHASFETGVMGLVLQLALLRNITQQGLISQASGNI